ncbi:hypothetical protein [Roseovarius sp. C03]|uniref:hypothetical protein n=1 Tax=Roseovarius sp. C03 TaxID=3449222 RepID=UPI003EDC19D6
MNFLGVRDSGSKHDPDRPGMTNDDHLVAGFDQVVPASAHFPLERLSPDFPFHPPARAAHYRAVPGGFARKQL